MTSPITTSELDLLRAAFTCDGATEAAWQRWNAQVDWDDHIEHAAFSLLPLVYGNLRKLDVQDDLLPRFKGIIRQAWLANQQTVGRLGATIAGCDQVGAELLVLPPTSHLFVDRASVVNRALPWQLAVRPEQAATALGRLLDDRWQAVNVRLPRWSLAGFAAGATYLVLRHDDDASIVLTWGLDHWLGAEWSEAWDRGPSLPHGAGRKLDSTDALDFHLRHGVTQPSFLAVAEVLRLASDDGIAWPRLVEAWTRRPLDLAWASRFETIQPLLDSLGAPGDWARFCGPPLPSQVHASPASFLQRCNIGWVTYRRSLGSERSLAGAVQQLPGYLMGRWNVTHLGSVPWALTRWMVNG